MIIYRVLNSGWKRFEQGRKGPKVSPAALARSCKLLKISPKFCQILCFFDMISRSKMLKRLSGPKVGSGQDLEKSRDLREHVKDPNKNF